MKKFIAGFLSGAIIFSAIGVFAVNSIYENPYKITVNGAEKSIQGYNIDDYSCFKLRDIADAVGGFSVDFDEQNQTIVSSSNDGIASPAAPSNPAATPNTITDIDNLPLGTIPDPMRIEIESVEIDPMAIESLVTNDEFRIGTAHWEGVPTRLVADRANEIIGENRYSDGIDGIMENGYPSRGEFLVEKDSVGIYTFEYYYQHVAPWLRSLKQAQ